MASDSRYAAVPTAEGKLEQQNVDDRAKGLLQISAHEIANERGTGRRQRGSFHGWKQGTAASAALCAVVLIFNVVLFVLAITQFSGSIVAGVGTVAEGTCDRINSLSAGLHVIINLLSSAMLSASNYTMQSLVAPTRSEIDRAHSKGKWLAIGVPSVRNTLGKISFWRILGIWLLVLSSVPIHLLYNSALFKTIDGNLYDVLVVNEDFLTGQPFDASNITLFRNGKPYHYNYYGNDESAVSNVSYAGFTDYRHIRNVQSFFVQNRTSNEAVKRLENSACIDTYGTYLVSGYSDVLLVTSDRTDNTNETFHFFDTNDIGRDPLREDSFGWVCSDDTAWGDCRYGMPRASRWKVNNYNIDYCLAKIAPGRCQLQFTLQVLLAVIACNAVKTIVICLTFLWKREAPIVTLGDGIATFLEKPDASSKPHIRYSTPTNPARGLWFQSFPLRFLTTFALCLAGVIAAGVYYDKGMKFAGDDRGLLERGFGTLDPAGIIGGGAAPQRGFRGLIYAILLSNLPQVICSFIYLAYNATFTSWLMVTEWSQFYLHHQPLRTSIPKGQQRSTYYLQLPFKYSIPLLVTGTLLHWLISQSLFLARIVVIRNDVPIDPPGSEPSRVAFSCLPILVVILLGVALIVILIGFGMRPTGRGMPFVGSNSLRIAGACHRPAGDISAAEEPVAYGTPVITDAWTSARPYGCFTSREVKEPS